MFHEAILPFQTLYNGLRTTEMDTLNSPLNPRAYQSPGTVQD